MEKFTAIEAGRLTDAALALVNQESVARARATNRAKDVVAFVKGRIEGRAKDGYRTVVAAFGSEKVSTNVRAIVIKMLHNDGFDVVRSSCDEIEVRW